MPDRKVSIEGDKGEPKLQEETVATEVPVGEPDPAEEVEDDVVDDFDEEPDPDSEVWDGGPTWAMVDAWKAEFKKVFVSYDPAGDEYYVWRRLTRHEYREITTQNEAALRSGQITEREMEQNNEEKIAAKCILFPLYIAQDHKVPAGFPRRMSSDILEMSGFGEMQITRL